MIFFFLPGSVKQTPPLAKIIRRQYDSGPHLYFRAVRGGFSGDNLQDAPNEKTIPSHLLILPHCKASSLFRYSETRE